MAITPLERRLRERLLRDSAQAMRAGFRPPTRFLSMLSELGPIQTAVALLATKQWQDGFTDLCELGLAELSLEARIIEEEWRPLFTDYPVIVVEAERRMAAVQGWSETQRQLQRRQRRRS
jgi:hypothetical protein